MKRNKALRKVCLSCQRRFAPSRADARYCCDGCRQKAHRSREESTDMQALDREIEQARLHYWDLIYKKARAMGRAPTQELTHQSQYIDQDGNVWMLDSNGKRRLAGKDKPGRPGWEAWGLEAAGPPWCPPGPHFKAMYESAILGKIKCDSLPCRNADGSNNVYA